MRSEISTLIHPPTPFLLPILGEGRGLLRNDPVDSSGPARKTGAFQVERTGELENGNAFVFSNECVWVAPVGSTSKHASGWK